MDSGESKPESAFFEAWPYPPPYEDDFRPSRGHRILRRSGSSSKDNSYDEYYLRGYKASSIEEGSVVSEHAPDDEKDDPLRDDEYVETDVASCIFNNKFQTLMDSISDTNILKEEQVFVELCSLARDFRFTALQYGKIIISEKHLPIEQKTIKPCTNLLGGLAGGEKFVKAGILFKFAIDTQGVYGSDELAAKEAGHQLKGAIGLFNTQKAGQDFAVPQLRIPLVMLIDYLGHRLVSMSLLPINEKTLLYGSSDAGKTVNASPIIKQTVADAADLLKLKLHKVGKSPEHLVAVQLPCDIEVHRGLDGRFYCIDFARLFPPEPPSGEFRSAHLVRMLRSELVRQCPTKLSSDAFSKFSMHDPERETHEKEVTEAYKMLVEQAIPAFALQLSAPELKFRDETELINQFHENGVNIRHLGRVRSLIPQEFVLPREQLLIEACARLIRIRLRRKLRREMRNHQLPVAEPYRLLIIRELNVVFGNTKEAKHFREVELIDKVSKKFTQILSQEEVLGDSQPLDTSQSLWHPFKLPDAPLRLFERVQRLMGIVLTPECAETLRRDKEQFFATTTPFDAEDVMDIEAMVKQMPIMEYAQGTALFIRAIGKSDTERKRIGKKAERCFQLALSVNSADYMTLCNYGFLYHSIFQDVYRSRQLYEKAIDINPNHVRSLYYMALLLQKSIIKDFDAAKAYFERAISVQPFHSNVLKDYAHLLRYHFRDLPKAEKMYRQALRADPKHTKALIGLGHVYLYDLSRRTEAGLLYKLAYESDQTNMPAVNHHLAYILKVGIVTVSTPVTDIDSVLSKSPSSDSILTLHGYNHQSQSTLLRQYILDIARDARLAIDPYLNGTQSNAAEGVEPHNPIKSCNQLVDSLVTIASDAGKCGMREEAANLFSYVLSLPREVDKRRAEDLFSKYQRLLERQADHDSPRATRTLSQSSR